MNLKATFVLSLSYNLFIVVTVVNCILNEDLKRNVSKVDASNPLSTLSRS